MVLKLLDAGNQVNILSTHMFQKKGIFDWFPKIFLDDIYRNVQKLCWCCYYVEYWWNSTALYRQKQSILIVLQRLPCTRRWKYLPVDCSVSVNIQIGFYSLLLFTPYCIIRFQWSNMCSNIIVPYFAWHKRLVWNQLYALSTELSGVGLSLPVSEIFKYLTKKNHRKFYVLNSKNA